jgi:nucleoside-diphosphate-sugar epimerase
VNIAILGSGHVGQTLAEGLHGAGHQVTIASRGGDKLADFSARSGIPELPFEQAAAGADLVVLAVLGTVPTRRPPSGPAASGSSPECTRTPPTTMAWWCPAPSSTASTAP